MNSEFHEPDFDYGHEVAPHPETAPKPAPTPVATAARKTFKFSVPTDGGEGAGLTALVERTRTKAPEEGYCLIVERHPDRKTVDVISKPIEIGG